MPNRFLAFAVSLLLCSCAPVSAQAQDLRAPSQPAASERATGTAEPTQDLRATVAAAQQSEQEAISARLQAESDALHAQETAQAVQLSLVALTATMQADNNQTSLKSQSVKATSDALIIYATATGRAKDIEQTTIDTELLNAQAANAKAQTEAKTAGTQMILLGGLVVGILILAVSMLWMAWQNQQEPPEIDENIRENEPVQPSAPVRGYERLPDGAINRDTDPPGDVEKFRTLIAHTRAGGYLGINVVVAAHIYSSNDEYQPVADWLFSHRYVCENSKGGKVFSSAGKQFVSEWEQRHPAPLPESVQKQPQSGHDNDVMR